MAEVVQEDGIGVGTGVGVIVTAFCVPPQPIRSTTTAPRLSEGKIGFEDWDAVFMNT
jgi:hypothetical protein